ncbi:ferredoxin [Nocardia nova]|uniref:Ferredoxin n=1 Tax=Nocardia nova TaxID=37330 RepID=A0A2S6AMZ5_9NOCA|nr:2Fe-2S iron-sulfur cluster-binding protein [Nocardia nova]PPJ25744.1 ferredoxin [Nocardia nova]PPJ36627.1 ferredoxin [Nocardia nova]
MAKVRIEPAGIDLDIRAGQTVFDAAISAGMTWPTICYGQARCTACALRVVDGRQNAGPIEAQERDALKQMAARRRRNTMRDTRLACRMTVSGDLTVEKPGVAQQAGSFDRPEQRRSIQES